jgi:hypothetical protein
MQCLIEPSLTVDSLFEQLVADEYATQLLEESMAPATKPDLKWWITTGLVVIGLIAGGVWTLANEFSRIDKHISKVETAVRIIGAKQGGDIKTLVDEALTVAKNAVAAGHTDNARAIVEMTNRLLAEQKVQHVQEPQKFFEQAFFKYQELKQTPALTDAARKATLTLTEYRSAIAAQSTSSQARIGEIRQVGQFTYIKDSTFVGPKSFINSPKGTKLDYLILDNVTFEDADISYDGGPITLHNVHFINCHFHVADSPRGDQLLAAAINQPSNAIIGG